MIKKIFLVAIISLSLLLILLFSGCFKPIQVEHKQIDVLIIDSYIEKEWHQPIVSGKIITTIYHPPRYIITVQNNNKKYSLNDKYTYNNFKDKVGDTVLGTFKIKKYKGGKVKYELISLK